MTAIEDAIKTVLDVAVGNYANYGAVPTLKIEDEEWTWYMKPRQIGVRIIAGDSGEAAQDHQGTVLFINQRCRIEGHEAKKTTCNNLYLDVRNLIAAAGYTMTGTTEPKPLSNIDFGFTIDVEKIQAV